MKAVTSVMLASLLMASIAFAAPDNPGRPIVAVYEGHYTCPQGLTRLTLKLGRRQPGVPDAVSFEFGPTTGNPDVPVGEFNLHGTLDPDGGSLLLDPLAWVDQPSGYVMVGLSGRSTDGGETFSGDVVSDYPGCTTFFVKRTRFTQ